MGEVIIGKVIQFVSYENNKQKPFKGNYAFVAGNYGVLCIWYISSSDCNYRICIKADFNYYPINMYICTLTQNCIPSFNSDENLSFHSLAILVGEYFTISELCHKAIEHQLLIIVKSLHEVNMKVIFR